MYILTVIKPQSMAGLPRMGQTLGALMAFVHLLCDIASMLRHTCLSQHLLEIQGSLRGCLRLEMPSFHSNYLTKISTFLLELAFFIHKF